MAKAPSIAIFAQSAAKTAYLGDLVTRAGLSVIDNGEAGLLLAEGAAPKGVKAEKIFILGEGENSASVRHLPPPVKASALIAILQNAHRSESNAPSILKIGNHTLDVRESLWISTGKESVRLTEKEVAILSYLARLKGSTISREDLLSCVWDYAQTVETHTLETHIYRLRQKIEDDPSNPKIILTMDDGYKLGV